MPTSTVRLLSAQRRLQTSLTRSPSVLSPGDSRRVDRIFIHVYPLHELVADL
jgi:hypothetical protein